MKSHHPRILFIYFMTLISFLLSACVSNPSTSNPPEKPSVTTTIQAEVKRLLAQNYIDPITRFIFMHEKDKAYQNALQTLSKERNHRCEQIAKQYQTQPKTQTQLDKLRKGYHFSCPQQVDAFAIAVTKAKKTVEEAPVLQKPDNNQQQTESLQACNRSYDDMNYARALADCKPLALRGYADAQLKLGMMYADGRGTTKDYQTAYLWLSLAVQSGMSQAKVLRDSIARLLSKEELVNVHDKASKISNAY